MKLIGNELGRVVALVHAEQWRPTHGLPLAATISAIQERYQFITTPILSAEAISEADRNGYRFANGTFNLDDATVAINELIVFRDGISVTTNHTSYAEAFFDDFIHWEQASWASARLRNSRHACSEVNWLSNAIVLCQEHLRISKCWPQSYLGPWMLPTHTGQ